METALRTVSVAIEPDSILDDMSAPIAVIYDQLTVESINEIQPINACVNRSTDWCKARDTDSEMRSVPVVNDVQSRTTLFARNLSATAD